MSPPFLTCCGCEKDTIGRESSPLSAPGGQGGDVLKEALTALKAHTEDQIMLQSYKPDKSFFDVWQVTVILKYTMKIFFTC